MKYSFIADSQISLSGAMKANIPGLKKGREKTLIAAREIKVNGKRTDGDIVLKVGDTVDAFVPEAYVVTADIRVIFEDENIVVADKPVRVDSETDLPLLLAARFGKLTPVHRLDTNTTGLIILARNDVAHSVLTDAFKNKRVQKTYTATVCGKLPQNEGVLKNYLVKDSATGMVTAHDERVDGGLEAVTEYRVIRTKGNLTDVILYPKTGRTHQLRVQLAHAKCPILGDGKYGSFDENRNRGEQNQRLRAVTIKLEGLKAALSYLNGKVFFADDPDETKGYNN